jgi:protein-S-isoprenylcysteine O-methyltransferase Ste14
VHDPLQARMNTSRSTPRVRAMTLAVLAVIVAVAVSDRPLFNGLAGAWVGFLGFVLLSVAALGRLWTSLFIAGFKDTNLVRTGPYAACRHPLYALSLLAMLGLGLGTRSLSLTVALVGLAAALHARAARTEDELLETIHGEAARRYRAEVPALWPDFSRHAVPESIEVHPRVYWKAVLDAGSLLLAFAAIQVAHVVQHASGTSAWLRLP